jgi:hypothetical protein
MQISNKKFILIFIKLYFLSRGFSFGFLANLVMKEMKIWAFCQIFRELDFDQLHQHFTKNSCQFFGCIQTLSESIFAESNKYQRF